MVLNTTFNLNDETIGGLCPEKQLYTSKVVLQVYAPICMQSMTQFYLKNRY